MCSVDGCDRPVWARGMCSRCYFRQRRGSFRKKIAGPPANLSHGDKLMASSSRRRLVNAFLCGDSLVFQTECAALEKMLTKYRKRKTET
jgi:hypothetical protein